MDGRGVGSMSQVVGATQLTLGFWIEPSQRISSTVLEYGTFW